MLSGRSTQGAPLIAGNGVIQALRCRILEGKEIDVEDHKVLVAEVLGIVNAPEMRRGQGGSVQDAEGSLGLSYGGRRYRSVGAEIAFNEEQDAGPESAHAGEQEPVHRTMGMNIRRGDEQSS